MLEQRSNPACRVGQVDAVLMARPAQGELPATCLRHIDARRPWPTKDRPSDDRADGRGTDEAARYDVEVTEHARGRPRTHRILLPGFGGE